MNAQTESHTRLQGDQLWAARVAWVAVVMVAVLMYAAAVPVAFNRLRFPCDLTPCQAPSATTSEPASALQQPDIQALEFGAWYHTITEAALRLLTLGVAVFIFWRRSDDWMALLASIMLVAVFAVFSPSPTFLVSTQPLWRWPLTLLQAIALASTVGLFYLFPDGRFVPRWTRWLAIAFLVLIGALAAAGAPFLAGFPIFVAALATGAGFQVYRYRRASGGLQRQQTKWVMLGITGMAVPMLVFFLLVFPNPSMNPLLSTEPVSPQGAATFNVMLTLLIVIPLCFLPVTLAFSLLRYRLWDADIVINRALVYGALTAVVVSIYVVVVVYLGGLFQARDNLAISLIATGLVAVVFQPLRQRFQRAINHVMYGDRDEPYAALSRLGRRLEASLAPEAVLPTVVTTVREALKLPYVAIYMKESNNQNKIVAESASASLRSENGRVVVPGMEHAGLCMPLIHQGETLGYIVLGPRAPNEAFISADLRLLHDLAPQVGVAVLAVRLTADLQRSRERLILAREEERRRLRRDLHDGLGPALANLTLQIEAARDLLPVNIARADALLVDLTAQAQVAIADIRRLVYDLRPPALDELGLVSALREQAAQYAHSGVQFTLDAPESLAPLPAAVEVAAYRIAQEALTNVVRHAYAQHCALLLTLNGALCLEIRDDGRGLPSDHRLGVGLDSMRERAAELGGQCVIEAAPSKGTLVRARLPLG